jgi:Na+-transporting methylmalonyl-CoA/oxaloacetate decarboxylase gamma subunit
MPFVSRGPQRGPGRFLQWKIRLIVIGAVLLLVGMARGMDLLVLVSLVFLCGAFVLRFFEKDGVDDEEVGDDDGTMEDDAEADDRPLHRRVADVDHDGMRTHD